MAPALILRSYQKKSRGVWHGTVDKRERREPGASEMGIPRGRIGERTGHSREKRNRAGCRGVAM